MPFLKDRMPATRYPLLMHVIEPSGNTAWSGIHTRASTRVLHSSSSPIRICRTNQALATTFWSPVVLNDIGQCHSCRVREARVRCPFDERKGQNRSRHRPTATMDHH